MSNSQEEIDLLSILKNIKDTIYAILKSIFLVFKTTLIHYVSTLIIIALSVSISVGIFYSIKKYYKSELIIVNNSRVFNKNCKEIVTNLNSLVNQKINNEELSKKLSLTESQSEKIKSISFLSISQPIDDEKIDTSSIIEPFKISVKVYDYSVLPDLQKGLLNYLKTNEYVLLSEKAENIELESLNAQLGKQLESLNELKTKIIDNYIPKSQNSGVTINNPIEEPAELYETEYKLYKTKFEINRKQQLNTSFEVLQSFVINKSPVTSRLLINILIGGLIGYLISFSIAIFRQKNNIQ